jgi:hypothetical protein
MNEGLLIRSFGWAIARIGKQTLLTNLLLVAGIGGLVFGLDGVLRGIDLSLLLLFSLSSMFFGWWLARSHQTGWAAAVESSAAAVIVIFGQVGQIGLPLLTAARLWLGIIWQGWPWRAANWAPFLAAQEQVWLPFQALGERLISWSTSMIAGEAAVDPAASTLAWSFILWAVAGWAGWSIRRWRAVLLGMAPAGGLLAVTLNFTQGNIYKLLLFLTPFMLLIFCLDISQR